MVVMEGGNAKYRLDLFMNIQNAFNNVNYNAFIGNQLSPFFGTPTSAVRRGASSSASRWVLTATGVLPATIQLPAVTLYQWASLFPAYS